VPGGSTNAGPRADAQTTVDSAVEPAIEPVAEHPTAVQVCNMLCEMVGSRGAGVGEAVLAQCFASDVRISNLSSGAAVATGQKKVASTLAKAPAGHPKASKTVFVESSGSATSLVLGFFAPGEAPGFGPRGLAKSTDSCCNPRALALLMRTEGGRLNHVWFVEDRSGFGLGDGGHAELVRLDLWADVMAVVRESLAPSAVDACVRHVTFHLNHYAVSSDGLGLGLGETSACETWYGEVSKEADHYFANPKASTSS